MMSLNLNGTHRGLLECSQELHRLNTYRRDRVYESTCFMSETIGRIPMEFGTKICQGYLNWCAYRPITMNFPCSQNLAWSNLYRNGSSYEN